jgi:hypothetical protein
MEGLRWCPDFEICMISISGTGRLLIQCRFGFAVRFADYIGDWANSETAALANSLRARRTIKKPAEAGFLVAMR